MLGGSDAGGEARLCRLPQDGIDPSLRVVEDVDVEAGAGEEKRVAPLATAQLQDAVDAGRLGPNHGPHTGMMSSYERSRPSLATSALHCLTVFQTALSASQ